MNIKTPILLLIALMGAVPLLAQANSTQTSSQITKPVTPYGENPNLLHVFAYKAQEGVINTAEKVGKVTEKSIARIKPDVDRAWNNTKSVASVTIQKVDQGTQQAAQQANQRIQSSREAWGGTPQQPAPIIQQPLSQSSTATQTTAPLQPHSGATSYAITEL